MTKILVVEDEENIAEIVQRGLRQSGFEVDVANTGTQGLELAQKNAPDLVVLDLMLPDFDGIEVCRQIRADGDGDVGIIMLTARQLVGDRIRGLEAGADDYLPKPFEFGELLARIRSILRRKSASKEGVIRVGDLVLDVDRREVRRGDRPIELSTREFDLLNLMAQNGGRPVRRELILDRVWGYEFASDSDPVKVYVNYLRRKLNANGESDLIHTVRGFGYALKESV